MDERGSHGVVVLSMNTPGAIALTLLTGEKWHGVGFYFRTGDSDENCELVLFRTRASPVRFEKKLAEGGWGLNLRKLGTLLPVSNIEFYPLKQREARELRTAITSVQSHHKIRDITYEQIILESLGLRTKHSDGFSLVSRVFNLLDGSRISSYEVLTSQILAPCIPYTPAISCSLPEEDLPDLLAEYQKMVSTDPEVRAAILALGDRDREARLVREAYETLSSFSRNPSSVLELRPLYKLVEHLGSRYSLPPLSQPEAGAYCLYMEPKKNPEIVTSNSGDLRNLSTSTLQKFLEILEESPDPLVQMMQNKIIDELAFRS